ncbi:MAG: DUF669 domain-containing protein [Alistipes senegalensis]|nr:DUF669 domain-containing protein [Alistipes senegalensis]
MGFSTNYEDVQDFDLIPKGEYEVIITKIEERTTQNGATGLNFALTIRNDVEQKCKNRCIFHTLWKRREPTQADMQVQGYSFKQIMQLAKAVRLPSGKSYETVYSLCDELSGKIMRVTVGHREYNDKTYEEVKYMNESQFSECRHTLKTAVTSDTVAQRPAETFTNARNISDYEEIFSDGDLPF